MRIAAHGHLDREAHVEHMYHAQVQLERSTHCLPPLRRGRAGTLSRHLYSDPNLKRELSLLIGGDFGKRGGTLANKQFPGSPPGMMRASVRDQNTKMSHISRDAGTLEAEELCQTTA